ncbi:MAG TPA: cytochrome b/b6 domain-containing protein [Terriglobales bacterium]|nr:cytochrome b/b6 domain-containing protein [Terriglobales bacterium]
MLTAAACEPHARALRPSTLGAAAFLLILLAGSAAGQKLSNADCLACHGDNTLSTEQNGKPVSLYVDDKKFQASAHSIFGCTDCHADVKAVPHQSTPAKPACATCHAEQQAAYDSGYHAAALRKGDPRAARCLDCHGSPHELLPAADPASRVHRTNLPATCGACHGQKFVMEASGHSAQPFFSYQESVHGRAVAAGSEKAAVCTDCHGSHAIRTAGDPKSPIFKFNVPNTCGQCHGAVDKVYAQSIHGQAIARGNWQAPVCTDCHGIHSIKAPVDPASTVSAQKVAQVTCARCHEGVRLTQEFGVPSHRVSTYMDSYHGLASKLGSQVVANCASCHGVHNILPSSDARSTINRANLVKTCGQCHPGVTERFVLAKVHVDAPLSADTGSVIVRWVRRFYISMILAVIGAMLAHNFLIWRMKAMARRKADNRVLVRMTLNQRVQHLTLLSSFFVLVITGFALKFPDSWFGAMVGGETVRGIVHRVAAVVLISLGFYHVIYAAVSGEGRRLVRDFLPTVKDAGDVLQNLAHYLEMRAQKPQFGRFNYAEKAEYWALVWGMVVMAGTGIMLWAKVTVGDLIPRWWLDVASAVHFYEAVLATLAILAWHFYQVFFDPDTYPMNWAWYDGKMSLEHYREEHALDTSTLLEASRAEAVALQDTESAAAVANKDGHEAGPAETASDKSAVEEADEVAARRQ